MAGFIIWVLIGIVFIGMGLYMFIADKQSAFGFWANIKTCSVSDVRAYNRVMGKLWCVFGMGFSVLGIPLLAGEDSPYALLSIIGVMFEVIFVMVFYVTVIEKKYRKSENG